MQIEANSIEEISKYIATMRGYQPFRFGGTWFIAQERGLGFLFRTKQPLINRKLTEIYKVR